MATDLTIQLDDRPGALARVAETLGGAGVNIIGICGISSGKAAELHILVHDPERARSALEGSGLKVQAKRQIHQILLEDYPGELGAVTRRLADAGVNLELIYIGMDKQVIVGVDDHEAAAAVL